MLGKLSLVSPALLGMMRSGPPTPKVSTTAPSPSATPCGFQETYVLDMVASGTVQDVIVITVRCNDVRTKQVLAQALFNLLARWTLQR